MTDDTTTEPEPVVDEASSGDQPEDAAVKEARRDAAGYRRRLREAEAERDALTAERDTMREKWTARQRFDVETAAAALGLVDGTDVWSATELDALLTEDGDVDQDKVKAAVTELLAAKPHWRRPSASFDLGNRGPATPRTADWDTLLKGRR